jgi:molybdopterin/thiamine biosynthesis adenylyltransferase
VIPIHLVGCGALGGQLAVEIAKRAAATKKEVQLYLYDFDHVEDRNVFSQIFSPKHAGKLKAEIVGEMCVDYPGVTVTVRPWKITDSNIENMKLHSKTLLIDAVDNIPTRQLLWTHGVAHEIPVLHAGMSYTGTGSVSWNCGEHDTFPLSPRNLSPEQQLEVMNKKGSTEDEVKLPPCDLNASRSMSLNTVHAALDAIWLFLGQDIASVIPEGLEDLGRAPGIMLSWETNAKSRDLLLASKQQIGLCKTWHH